MAGYKGHTAGAVIAGFLVLLILNSLVLFFDIFLIQSIISSSHGKILIFTTTVAFALFPDIDTNSVAQDIYYALFFVVDLFLIGLKFYKIAAFFGLAALLPVIASHRGWTHTKYACFLIPLPIAFIPMVLYRELTFATLPYYFAAVSGYMSHLIIDRKF